MATEVKGQCNCCERETEIWPVALPFAAMTVVMCRTCLTADAYPLWALHSAAWILGGYRNADEWFCNLRSWHNGEYIEGPRVRELFGAAPQAPQAPHNGAIPEGDLAREPDVV